MSFKLLSNLRYDPLSYLLGPRQPAWVKYRTLVSLLKRDEADWEVVKWRKARDASSLVRRLHTKQISDGSFPAMPWRHTHTYEFNQLIIMGFGLDDPTVRRAVESLLQDQIVGGGFDVHRRTAKGVEKNNRSKANCWDPCITAFMTKTLLDLGMRKDPRVEALLILLRQSQRDSGGWICQRFKGPSPYCIRGGTPWVLSALTTNGTWNRVTSNTRRTIELIEKHKEKIVKHGYQRDLCYRCDEALLLPSLHKLGMNMKEKLFADLYDSLVTKQTPNGYWCFRGKPSAWYTLEVTTALQSI